MKPLYLPLFIIIIGIQAFAGGLNLDKSGLAIAGYDPVSYFMADAVKKGPLKGDTKYQVNQEGAKYLFASEANKKEFEKNPTKYLPAFGGWCAYAVAEKKEKVEVDPRSFIVQDGRLLLFYNGILADTRHKWLNNKSKTPVMFLKEADAHWPEIKDKGI